MNGYSAAFHAVNNSHAGNLEAGLEKIKAAGATLGDSVCVVAKALKVAIADADLLVLHSETWSFRKAPTLDLRNKIKEAIIR